MVPFCAYTWSTQSAPQGALLPTLHSWQDSCAAWSIADATNHGAADGKEMAAIGAKAICSQGLLIPMETATFNGKTYLLPWYDKTAAAFAPIRLAYYQAVKAAGATIDYEIADSEYGMGAWNGVDGGDLNSYAVIIADRRWQSLKRYMGYTGADDAATWKSWIYASQKNMAMFDKACTALRLTAWALGIIGPLRSVFPRAVLSDFDVNQVADQFVADNVDPNNNSFLIPALPSGMVGSPVAYGYDGPNLYAAHPEYKSPFGATVRSVNILRMATASAPATPYIAWTECKDTDPGSFWYQFPWHNEWLRHLLLYSPTINLFNPGVSATLDDLNATFAEVSLECGGAAPTKPTMKLAKVSDGSLVSMATLPNGWTVGRVTFAPGVTVVAIQMANLSVTLNADGNLGRWFKFHCGHTLVPTVDALIL